MSLDLAARLRIFFASAPQTIHPVQVVQISHSAMSQVFTLWREPVAGSVTIDGVAVDVVPCNIEIKPAGSPGHLDQVFDIRLNTVDIEDAFREQLDRIPIDTAEKIRVRYFEYLSDDLTAPMASATLQAESTSYMKGAASISAVSPRLNALTTGQLYTPKDVPMLRAFL